MSFPSLRRHSRWIVRRMTMFNKFCLAILELWLDPWFITWTPLHGKRFTCSTCFTKSWHDVSITCSNDIGFTYFEKVTIWGKLACRCSFNYGASLAQLSNEVANIPKLLRCAMYNFSNKTCDVSRSTRPAFMLRQSVLALLLLFINFCWCG